jgi:hypothetical protein
VDVLKPLEVLGSRELNNVRHYTVHSFCVVPIRLLLLVLQREFLINLEHRSHLFAELLVPDIVFNWNYRYSVILLAGKLP